MGHTISAYVSDETARRFDEIIAKENRVAAQAGAAALDLYTTVPPEGRRALAFIQEQGTPEEKELLVKDVARAIVAVQFEIARRNVVGALNVPGIETMSEEELDELAVREARRGRGHRAADTPARPRRENPRDSAVPKAPSTRRRAGK